MESGINPKLEKYIATRDRKLNAKSPYSLEQPLREAFMNLVERGEISFARTSSAER